MTFDSVPESHTYKYSTFQAQNPGRFLSCMRKEMALLTFSLPAGIIVRGYEDRVVILCLFSNFFCLYLSQSSAVFFALGAAEMETKVVWNVREVFNHWNPETQLSICLVQHKATDWPKSIASLSQPIRTPTQNQYMLGCCARFTRLALYSPL